VRITLKIGGGHSAKVIMPGRVKFPTPQQQLSGLKITAATPPTGVPAVTSRLTKLLADTVARYRFRSNLLNRLNFLSGEFNINAGIQGKHPLFADDKTRVLARPRNHIDIAANLIHSNSDWLLRKSGTQRQQESHND
jgi:hypothetical protein